MTGVAGRGGRGATGGGGRGGLGGEAGLEGEPDGGAGIGGAGGAPPDAGGVCTDESACDDGNDCTADVCDGSRCNPVPIAAGMACGESEAGECGVASSCDGAGACVAGDAPNGSACEGGSCTLGECIEGRPVGCPAEVVTALPFETSWRTVGGVNLFDGGCDAPDTPDFAVIFTAPASATYLFEAAGEVGTDDPETPENVDSAASEEADSVITIAAGACAGLNAMQHDCNDDVTPNVNFDSSRLLQLVEGQTVTVYAGEVRERVPGGGSGTLRISVVDD